MLQHISHSRKSTVSVVAIAPTRLEQFSRHIVLRVSAGLMFTLLLQACSGPNRVTKSANENTPPPPKVWLASEWKEDPKGNVEQRREPVALTSNIPPDRARAVRSSLDEADMDIGNVDQDRQTSSVPKDQVVENNQCWAQMVKWPQVQENAISVVTRDEATVHEVRPAVLQNKNIAVTVKDSARTFRLVAPKFKPVVEQVKISDEVRRLAVVPAVYEDREEQVIVESARAHLQTCSTPGQRAVGPDAKSLQNTKCLQQIPPRYKTITKKVLVTPETVKEEIVPAKFKSVVRWKLENDGRAESQELPAQLVQMPYRSMEKAPEVVKHKVEAQAQDIVVKEHVGLPQLAWRRVLCERDLSPALVQRMQSALAAAGEDTGASDGKLGPKTWRAIANYQNKHGLAAGMLSFETLDQLGIALE
jgi:Putative peptidoglycan binding domain